MNEDIHELCKCQLKPFQLILQKSGGAENSKTPTREKIRKSLGNCRTAFQEPIRSGRSCYKATQVSHQCRDEKFLNTHEPFFFNAVQDQSQER